MSAYLVRESGLLAIYNHQNQRIVAARTSKTLVSRAITYGFTRDEAISLVVYGKT